MTSSTVSSESVARQERGDPCGIDHHPAAVQNEDHDQERGDPCHSEMPEWLEEFRENLVDDRVPERRDSPASSSHGSSLEATPARSVDLGITVFILTSRKTEIARFARGPKSQGPHAEDVLAGSYFVQKILVI